MCIRFHRTSKSSAARAGVVAIAAMLGSVSAQERTVHIPLVADARSPLATEWRFMTDDPGVGWFESDFDDAAWFTGRGGFGVGTAQSGAAIGQDWSTPDIWLRKSFDVASLDFESLFISLQHDEAVEIYLNGTQVFTEPFVNGMHVEFLSDEAKAELKLGKNVLAVHCRNTDGPGYIDVGLSISSTMQATALVADARYGGEDWKYTDVNPGSGWNDTGFADDGWIEGHSGFGSTEFAAQLGTSWLNYDIWIRKHITLDHAYSDYLLSYIHDDEVVIYVNGKLLVQESGSGTEYKEAILPAASVGLAPGDNVFALRCTNSGGGPQFVDGGLIGLERSGPVDARRNKATHAASGAAFPRALYVGPGSEVNLSAFPSTTGAGLEVYGMDGALRASLHPAGKKSASLPSRLGTGTFRYLWRSPSGSAQGLLINLP